MKKILIIGYDYYHYTSSIVKEVESLGFVVDYFSIEPNGLAYKLSRYGHKFSNRFLIGRGVKYFLGKLNLEYKNNYYQDLLARTSGLEYEKIFFLTTLFIPACFIALFRKNHPTSEFIAYHWDSLGPHNDYLDNVKYFDRIYSFDSGDCNRYGYTYLPLFASGAYDDVVFSMPTIDIYSVGTVAVLDRYFLAQQYKQLFESMGLICYLYLKVTPISYLRLLLKGVIPKNVYFRNLNPQKMSEIVSQSKSVLDVPNHKQTGLTMRVIENISIGMKVVTTNENIANEAFYDKRVVHILGVDDQIDLPAFINGDYRGPRCPELKLNSWIKKVLL